uniref:Uncharacterized protein n=1 Tax=Rhizophora mucronata TaxID=61149 RepID=A0A2P2IWH9_RHIMU
MATQGGVFKEKPP